MNFVAPWLVHLPTPARYCCTPGLRLETAPEAKFWSLAQGFAPTYSTTPSHASCLVSILSRLVSVLSLLIPHALLSPSFPVRYLTIRLTHARFLHNGRVISLMHRPWTALPYAALTVPTITDATGTALYRFSLMDVVAWCALSKNVIHSCVLETTPACASLPSVQSRSCSTSWSLRDYYS